MTLKDKLHKLRRSSGFSQEELAEKLDVSRQAVSKWERGESFPDTNNLIKLAQLYDIPVDELASCIRGDSSIKYESIPSKSKGISLKKPVCAENAGIADDFIGIDIPVNDTEEHPSPENKSSDNTNGARSTAVPFNAYTNSGTGYNNSYTNTNNGSRAKKHKARTAADPVRAAHCKPFKKFPFWALMLLFMFFFGGVFGLWEYSWLFLLLIPLYYTSIAAYERCNLNYFCYPVAAVIGLFGCSYTYELFFGYSNDIWDFNAVAWLLSIPLYYTGIAAARHKNCKYFCFPVLVVMLSIMGGMILNGEIERFLWMYALIPFYYVYSSSIDRLIFDKK